MVLEPMSQETLEVVEEPGLDERAEKIVDVAMRLAEQGGFQAVRLRDVAAQSGVALGTLYVRFRSKEDILVAALEREVLVFEELLQQFEVPGETPLERLRHFFTISTQALFMRPNFAQAVLRSMASGVPEIAEKIARYQGRITHMIVEMMRGGVVGEGEETEEESYVAFLMQQIWFAALIGWMGGLLDEDGVVEHVSRACGLLLLGMRAGGVEGGGEGA